MPTVFGHRVKLAEDVASDAFPNVARERTRQSRARVAEHVAYRGVGEAHTEPQAAAKKRESQGRQVHEAR